MSNRIGVIALGLAVLASPARADRPEVPLYASSYYELTYTYASGGYGFDGPAFAGGGIRLYERAGFLAALLPGVFLGAAGGIAEGGALTPHVTTTVVETQTYRETTITSRERTPEEVARAKAAADAATAVRGVPGHAELAVFFPHGDRRASGVAIALYPLSWGGRFTIDAGVHLVRLRDDGGPVDDNGPGMTPRDGTRNFRSAGTSLRGGLLALGNRVQVEAEWMLNLWYWGDGDDPMTPTQERRGSLLRGSLALNPVERVLVRAALTTPMRFDDLGWSIEAGVRF